MYKNPVYDAICKALIDCEIYPDDIEFIGKRVYKEVSRVLKENGYEASDLMKEDGLEERTIEDQLEDYFEED